MAEIRVKSEITGKVWQIDARVGQELGAEEPILTLESMKMEIPVLAPSRGVLRQVLVAEGDSVQEGQDVAVLDG